jgi:hypothetical protein
VVVPGRGWIEWTPPGIPETTANPGPFKIVNEAEDSVLISLQLVPDFLQVDQDNGFIHLLDLQQKLSTYTKVLIIIRSKISAK